MRTTHTRTAFVAAVLGAFALLLLAGCGSASGSHTDSSTPPPVVNVVVSGVVTFDRVPFSATAGAGLDFALAQAAPARNVTIEVLAAAGNSVIATTQTDATGGYSLTVPANTNVFLRAKAQMIRTGTPAWTYRVLDNTSGNALYTFDGAAFDSGGVATLVRNLHAPSGWDSASSSYPANPAARAAAPFAILDTIYRATQLVLNGDPQAVFPPLDVFWSPRNNPSNGTGDPTVDIPNGDIGTTYFAPGSPAALYVLGAADVDTDEFDAHYIARTWGHYYQDTFSRDDSVGGDFDPTETLDLRVAFSEGWADAFAGMVTGDPLFRDSFGPGEGADGGANLESGTTPLPGWFSEGSIALVLYDLFDGSTGGDNDGVQVDFASIHAAMKQLATTDALTSVYPFVNALTAIEPTKAAAIRALVTTQDIEPLQPDDFGSAETNDGGDADNLPVYTAIAPGDTRQVCSKGAVGQTYNKLGNRRFLRLDLPAPRTVTISVTEPLGGPDGDPDVVVFQRGVEIGRAEILGDDTLQLDLTAGTYVIETYEGANVWGEFPFDGRPPVANACIDVAVAP